MIYWAPLLHFYQPPVQYHAILRKIANECYRPLLKMFLEHPHSKVTINMCGVLTELLNDHGAGDVLDYIRELAQKKQLEFVDSAKYHAILPLISTEEMKRQIRLNRRTNEYFFKSVYKPIGFFPPEMCYSSEVGRVLADMGYDWVIISGVACQGVWPLDFVSNVSYGSSSIKVFFRDDIISNKISFRSLDSASFMKGLIELSKGKENIYVITAMDAETFGHHIHHWEKLFLAEVYETIDTIERIYHEGEYQKNPLAAAYKDIFSQLKDTQHIEVVTVSELLKKFPTHKAKPPKLSSWSTTKEDILKKNYYPLWDDKNNKIHQLQLEHLGLSFEIINKSLSLKSSNKDCERYAVLARGLLDRSVYSCQSWWANKATGRWDINLIHKGLVMQEEALLNAYKAISLSSMKDTGKKDFYHKVTAGRDIANKIRDLLIAE